MPSLLYRWLLLYGMTLLFKECESLFLRQTESGKCITTGELAYDNPDHEKSYFAVMTDNCLNASAKFRYLDTGLLHNIEKDGTLLPPKSTYYKSRLVVYHGVSNFGVSYQNNDHYRLKQTDAGSLFFYNMSEPVCAEPKKTYVKKSTTCDGEKQYFTFGSVTDYGAKIENVHCSPVQRMVVESANYGDFNKKGIFNEDKRTDTTCSALASCQLKSHCNGRRSCALTMNNDLLPPSYCSDTSKQIYTKYTCRDSYDLATITTASNIRLTSSYQGNIQIRDSSIWRYVKEENWDENRQKMLCQYLGFSGTEDRLKFAQFGRGHNIPTGDLICHKLRSREVRCCVYLTPSINKNIITIPSAVCKICENPIQPRMFSGSRSNNYNKASFERSGWCASGSAPYLWLDLGKEYRVTRVITMGNKDQTKWSESYSLRYSYSRNLVNHNTPITISGNQYSYLFRASTTNVNIYNARYIIINSKKNQGFCVRIQLCGEVQKPAPVYDIRITQVGSYQARMSWKLQADAFLSSFITHIIVYLDKAHVKTVPRGTLWIDITGLKPSTSYTVRIQTVDGSSQSSIVSVSFTTTEAALKAFPTNVQFTFRSKNSLMVSWNEPDTRTCRCKVIQYKICYSTQESTECETSLQTQASETHVFVSRLLPSTKYFFTISARSKNGYGPRSKKVSRITNGEPVNIAQKTYSSLVALNITPAAYIKDVMVIVSQSAPKYRTNVEDITGSSLKAYQANTRGRYIAAFFKIHSGTPSNFVIGDDKKYYFKGKYYVNKPLEQNSSYIVFLRYFENEGSYYSTGWSKEIRTFAKPPAPIVTKFVSTGPKKYAISWFQPQLPNRQTVQGFYAHYSRLQKVQDVFNISRESKTITIDVEFAKQYTFEIQVETNAGRSNVSSMSWFSHSDPLNLKETNESYNVVLKRPPEDQHIKTVALVMLQLQSESSVPFAPENLTVSNSAPSDSKENNVAFIAKEFDITDFQGDTMEIILRKPKVDQRRKRESNVVDTLAKNATYRVAQRNTDGSKEQFWSYWSEPFTILASVKNNGGNGKDGGIGNENKEERNGDGDGRSVGAAVGVSLAVIFIVIALVFIVLFFKRRRMDKSRKDKETVSKENTDDEMDAQDDSDFDEDDFDQEGVYSNQNGDADGKKHPPVPVEEFAHFVNEMKANNNYEFQKEYDDLPKNMKTSWEVSKKPFNKIKNRYGNIVTYDHARVVLSGDETEDYINASYIDGINENSYIASQGPTPVTLDDMWRMIWEQRCYSIVMVTSLAELGKPKCEKYWPDEGSQMYGDIEVTLKKVEEFACHVTHILQIKKDGEEREVLHHYFQSWPDHGVPKYPTQLLAFRKHFRTHHVEQSGPIVVHCSAGVGRTGVFLAIDMILTKLDKGVINSIDVFGEVCAMRERRMNMVQTLEQFVFVHEAILESIMCGMNEVDSARIQKEIESLAQVQASGMTGFQEKFKRLSEVSPKLSPDECVAGLLKGNLKKNRRKNICPAESGRVPLPYINGVEDSDYINAVFVHGYLGKNYFIATQSPLANTINDFWRMVHSQKSSTIVLLNNVKEGTSFPKFWPIHRGKPIQYGSLTVQLDSEKSESDGILTRKLILSPYPDLSDGQVVNIFHHMKWPDHQVPPKPDAVVTLTSLVENSRKNFGQGPIIVVCGDGAGRTGTYIAISNLLERMKIEQVVDVFQAVKIIRGTRPQFVENVEQYQFCYTAITTYMDSFSDYANFE